jgi:hypothetical protein
MIEEKHLKVDLKVKKDIITSIIHELAYFFDCGYYSEN